MSDSLLREAYQAYAHWHKEIIKTEAYQKTKLLENVILSFGGVIPHGQSMIVNSPIVEQLINKSSPSLVNKTNAGQKEKIEALAVEAIRYYGGRAQKAKIFEYFMEHGLEITSNNLGWYLSHAKNLFTPDRSLGWGLVEDKKINEINTQVAEESYSSLFDELAV